MTNTTLFLPRNDVGRDFVVGDLHGSYDLLIKGLDQIGFNKDIDRLFAVGDLIDRGPDSLKCLQLVKEPWFWSVIGNHEDMMLEAVNGGSSYDWMWNGGEWWLTTADDEKIEAEALVRSLPLVIVVGRYSEDRFHVMHSVPCNDSLTLEGIESGDIGYFGRQEILWSRNFARGYHLDYDAPFPTFFGHTVQLEPSSAKGYTNLDTGAVFNPSHRAGGYLTIINARTREFTYVRRDNEKEAEVSSS